MSLIFGWKQCVNSGHMLKRLLGEMQENSKMMFFFLHLVPLCTLHDPSNILSFFMHSNLAPQKSMYYLGITISLPTLAIFPLHPSKAHSIPPIPLFIHHPSIKKSLKRFICTLKYHPNDYEPNQINTTLTFFLSSLPLPILFNQPKT